MDDSITLPERPKDEKVPKPKKPAKEPKPKPVKDPKVAHPKKEVMPAANIDPTPCSRRVFEERLQRKPSEHVITRFPPEPNGFLHIGHSKAIAINFGFARYYGGDCYLRYDDTNPEKEEEIFFNAIREIIEWLGFKPFKTTYSSDNFDKLYELAEVLIKRDGAYVCHCSDIEVKKQRGEGKGLERYTCEHRDRPIEESLTEFRAMRDGKYKPREAMLRMKQDMTSGNPQMWDLTAYRILNSEHHRSGNKFGRLKVTGTVLSKRKISKLVEEGIVRGWDDPRLYTLVALRRRGVPPGAILAFVNELGVSTALTNIQLSRFDSIVRRYLEQTVPRLMLVLDPIPIIIDNLPSDFLLELEVPFFPKDLAKGSHVIPFTNTIYIDRSDFREVDSKDYFRLAPGKSVGLLQVPYPIKATTYSKDEATGLITEVRATYEKPTEEVPFKKPKTYIQWVAKSSSHGSPIEAEVRVFSSLFKSEDPDAAEGGFMTDLNPKSEEIFPNAIIETGLSEVRKRAPWPEEAGEVCVSSEAAEDSKSKDTPRREAGFETVRFQGLRVAYFAMDKDSASGKVVLNCTVSLKEDVGKA